MLFRPRATRVLLLLGLLAGALPAQSPVLTLRSPTKERYLSEFGRPLAVLDDLDGDGIREILVGSPYETPAGAVYLFSGRTGRILFYEKKEAFEGFFGAAVANAGDVDGDGVSDFLVGDGEDGPPEEYIGSACLYSGRTGRLLLRLTGPGYRAFFGTDLAGAGDVNGDGHADFMVSACGDNAAGYKAGSVKVFSGADGSVLYTFYGTAPGANLAYTASAGDVNADGVPDFLVGEGGGGVARVYSGRDGSLILHLVNPFPEIRGFSFIHVAGLGDLDQDGFDDVALQSGLADVGGLYSAGAALIFSGRTGTLLYRIVGENRDDNLSTTAPLPDLDHDGFPDFAVASLRTNGPKPALVRGFSGRDGSLLFTLQASRDYTLLGTSIQAFDDLNGDGIPEFLASAPEDDAGAGREGTVTAFSPVTLVGVQEPVPGKFGTVNSIVASASAPGPGRTLLLFGARYSGFTRIPGCRPGFVFKLHDPKPVGVRVTDIFGKAVFSFFVPRRVGPYDLWFQVMEPATCLQSPLVSRYFR